MTNCDQKVGTAWIIAGAFAGVLAFMGMPSAFAWSSNQIEETEAVVDKRLHYTLKISKLTRFVAASKNAAYTWVRSEGYCNIFVNDVHIGGFPAQCNYEGGDAAEFIFADETEFAKVPCVGFHVREDDYIRITYCDGKAAKGDVFDVFINRAAPATSKPFDDAGMVLDPGH